MNEFMQRYAAACGELEDAVRNRHNPYHLIVVANVNEQGEPECRTVVLRKFDEQNRSICFHTDIRSPKVQALIKQPAISLLFYNVETKLQLRFSAQAHVHHQDAICTAQWEKTQPHSKVCYLTPHGSGEEVSKAEECGLAAVEHPVDNHEKDIFAFHNLAVIECVYSRLDMVQLNRTGHERMVLQWGDETEPQAKWIAV